MPIFVTDTGHFREGDFPEVCALTGGESSQVVEVWGDTMASPGLKEMFNPFAMRRMREANRRSIVGKLPIGDVIGAERLNAQWHPEVDRIVIRGISQKFIDACREVGKAT